MKVNEINIKKYPELIVLYALIWHIDSISTNKNDFYVKSKLYFKQKMKVVLVLTKS